MQRGLKYLNETNFQKLAAIIDKKGFHFHIQVWENEGIFYINDGHQRIDVLNAMNYKSCVVIDYQQTDTGLIEVKREVYDEVMLPFTRVYAKTKEEAIELIGMAASVYGIVDFENDLLLDIPDNILDNLALPDIQMDAPEDIEYDEDEDEDNEENSSDSSDSKDTISVSFALTEEEYDMLSMILDDIPVMVTGELKPPVLRGRRLMEYVRQREGK